MADIQRSHGGIFIQTDEDDPFDLLTCTGVGDVDLPAGDETPVYCQDPGSVGTFVITDLIEGEAGQPTYSMNRPLYSTYNYLLTTLRDCRWHARINWRLKGSVPDIFTNYMVGLHLHFSRATTSGVGQPVVDPEGAGENDRVSTTADISARAFQMIYPVTTTRITVAETTAINNIAFDLSSSCYEDEAGGDAIGKEGYFTSDHPAASAAVSGDVYYSTDYGATWALCNDPFGAAEDAGAVVTRGGRVIVERLTADAGNAAEIAISDDYGTTWSNVDVGSTNSQVVTEMWWLDWTHLWACTTGGYVYFSDDAGATWTAQTSGGLTAQNLQDICAYDRSNVWAVGAAGAIIRTTDGTNWALVTGPAGVADQFNTVYMRNDNRVFIGSDAGNVYRTTDAGTSWSAAFATPQWSGGSVVKIRAENGLRYFMYIAGNTSGSVGEVYRSEDGGASFYEVDDVPTNAGLNDLEVLTANLAWVCGEVQGATGFLAKISANE